MLRRKYEAPALGDMRMWELVELLAQCVDPSDGRLFGASQLVHVLQMLEAMERDGVTDPDMLLAALVHDVGKVLLLLGEDPANVVCMTAPIGGHEPGVGLDNVTMQWNHDEFGFTRIADHVPDHIAWLVRYHSIVVDVCEPLMDARDRDYYDRYLRTFSHYDHETKTPFRLPAAPDHRISRPRRGSVPEADPVLRSGPVVVVLGGGVTGLAAGIATGGSGARSRHRPRRAVPFLRRARATGSSAVVATGSSAAIPRCWRCSTRARR